jgi:hypothetical protein
LQSKKVLPKRYPPGRSSKPSFMQGVVIVAYLAAIFAIGTLTILFFSNRLTLGGVPASVIMSFLQDGESVNAYFSGDARRLHDRLDDIGIEQAMKDYYRPQIRDEVELDQYIHQILYERTGYVGEAYRVNGEGVLVLRND